MDEHGKLAIRGQTAMISFQLSRGVSRKVSVKTRVIRLLLACETLALRHCQTSMTFSIQDLENQALSADIPEEYVDWVQIDGAAI